MARARFWCCDFSACTTMMPVGRWVMRTAESVVLTCWPPAPDARIVSMRMSSGRISMSTSSASGSTATVAAEVWMRPLAFGRRHALDAVHAGFEFQLREDALARNRGDDFLVAAGLALARRRHLDAASPARRRSARTCGTGRRRKARPRRRRCRRGFRGWRSSRRRRPWAGAGSGCPAAAPRCAPRPREARPRPARASRASVRLVGEHRLEDRLARARRRASSRILPTISWSSAYSDASFT